MFWLIDLKDDADAAMLTRETLDLECGQNVQVIILLWCLRRLVAHDDAACRLVGLASLEVRCFKRAALDIDELLIVLWLLKYLVDAFIRLTVAQDDDLCLLSSMITVEAL